MPRYPSSRDLPHRAVAGSSAHAIVASGSTGIAYTTGGSLAPATNRLEKISSATTAPTMISRRLARRRSSSPISPAMRAAAEMAVRNATATQNNMSDSHQPVIRSVAMTAVAQPLRMLRMAVAIEVRGSGQGFLGVTAAGLARGM